MNLNLNDYRGSDTTPDLDNYDVIDLLTLENEANALFLELHELEVAMQLEDFDTNFANEVIEASAKFRGDPAFNSLFGEYFTGNEAGDKNVVKAVSMKDWFTRKLDRIEKSYSSVISYSKKLGNGMEVRYRLAYNSKNIEGVSSNILDLVGVQMGTEAFLKNPLLKNGIAVFLEKTLSDPTTDIPDVREITNAMDNEKMNQTFKNIAEKYQGDFLKPSNLQYAKLELGKAHRKAQSTFNELLRSLESDFTKIKQINRKIKADVKSYDIMKEMGPNLSKLIKLVGVMAKLLRFNYRAMRAETTR